MHFDCLRRVSQGHQGGELGSLFVRTISAIVTSRREARATSRSFPKWRRCHFQMLLLKLVFLDIDAPKWFLSRQDSAVLTSLSEKVSEMCINPKNNAYESCKQFRSISQSGIMCRKSLHVRTVISHFLEIGEVLNIETWHKDGLLLLENIVSEVN